MSHVGGSSHAQKASSFHRETRFIINMVAEHRCDESDARICERTVDVRWPQVVEQVLGETQTSSRDRTLQGTDLMFCSSQDPISTGKLVALISSQNMLNQYTLSDREDFPLRQQQVFGSNEPFIRFSNPANVAKSLLDGNRDHLLAEARSELRKQEYKVESLNTCISELQQQTCAQLLELEDSHLGYVESRREQVRLQEESVMKERALRDTQIRSIHEMGELKRAQELRVDEYSVQKIERVMKRYRSSLHKYKSHRRG